MLALAKVLSRSDAFIIVDEIYADLAILADSAERYAAYARAVREEYAFVPQELFRAGRAAVLQHLLDLPALFRVVPERDAWTSRARANLRAEIDELSRTA